MIPALGTKLDFIIVTEDLIYVQLGKIPEIVYVIFGYSVPNVFGTLIYTASQNVICCCTCAFLYLINLEKGINYRSISIIT